MTDTPTTPAELGYRLPAEWEPHAATWIAWPQEQGDWPGKFCPIPWVYTEIVRVLSQAEPVRIVVSGGEAKRRARSLLKRAGISLKDGCVQFVSIPTDRSWLRDTVPSFVVRALDADVPLGDPHEQASIAWRFNGWAKYDNFKKDVRLPRKLSKRLGIRRFKPTYEHEGKRRRVVLEGGSIDGNGRGTLLTTEECLLSVDMQERNPGLDREGYEQVFADYLGIRKTIWLGRGIAGDDTHGHVDDIARFVNPKTIVAAVEHDPSDLNYEPLQDNLKRLKSARDQNGKPLKVVELPMPGPVLFEGFRLPASYANFYIANGLVLVPTFNDPNDRIALDTLAGLFPDRKIVGIHCVDLVLGLGTLHCLTHELPAAALVETDEVDS